MRNGASAADAADGGRVGGAGGKGDIGFASARNSGIHRGDVFGVRTRKQRRKLEDLVTGLVGIEDVAVVAVNLPRVLIVEAGGRGVSDLGAGGAGSGGAGEYPKSLVGFVLAGIDIDDQLRLALFDGNKGKQSRGYESAKSQRLRLAGGGGVDWLD